MRAWKYLKGCEKDFDGAPDWATLKGRLIDSKYYFVEHLNKYGAYQDVANNGRVNQFVEDMDMYEVIAHRKPITDEQDLNDCIGSPEADNKYLHEIKPGAFVDVYDVLMAWNVTNPALQHLIKKALQAGERGHKSREQDLQDIIDSAIRAKELEVK